MTKINKNWHLIIIALVLGAIYPLAFAPLNWWPLAMLSVAGFYWLLQNKTPKQGFWLGVCYGTGLFGVGVSWFYVSIHVHGNAPLPLAVFMTCLAVLFLSLFFALQGYLSRKYLSRLSGASHLIAFALLWLLLDLARGSGFVSFPWLYIGYSQTNQIFSGVASIFGVHGLSLFMLLLSLSLGKALVSQQRKYLIASVIMMVTGFVASQWALRVAPNIQDSATIAMVQPNIEQQKKWDPKYRNAIIGQMIEQTENLWGADLIVWPEAAIPSSDKIAASLLVELDNKAKESGSHLLTGIPLVESREEYYAGLVLLGGKPPEKNLNSSYQTYRKQQLVPFGEYVPFQSILRGLIDFFDLPMSSFTPGSAEQDLLITDKLSLIPAICYEIAFSGLIQQSAEKDAPESSSNNINKQPKVILTISNDTWFGTSWGPLQHFQMAQMRAIENGLPVVRGTNNGLTAVINHLGQIENELPRFEQDELSGLYVLENRDTLFRDNGYWILITFFLVLLFIAIYVEIKKRF